MQKKRVVRISQGHSKNWSESCSVKPKVLFKAGRRSDQRISAMSCRTLTNNNIRQEVFLINGLVGF